MDFQHGNQKTLQTSSGSHITEMEIEVIQILRTKAPAEEEENN